MVDAAIGYALDVMALAAGEAAGGPIVPVLVSAMAEGADRFAAQAALARRWRLETPLPFPTERYEQDFSDEDSIQVQRKLLKKSKRLEIAPDADQPGAAPYASVGRLVVEWSDAIIAVWNGAAPKGPGGTAEVAALMIEKGGPVIWIPSILGGPLQLICPDRPRNPALCDALALRFPVVARPDEMRTA